MKRLSAEGFTHIMLVLFVMVVVAVGGVGYLVYRAQQKSMEYNNTDTPYSADIGGPQSNNLDKAPRPAEIPEGWQTYSNEVYGFAYAYPKEWGDLEPAHDSPDPRFFDYQKTSSVENLSATRLFGSHFMSIRNKNGYTVNKNKNGATIMPDSKQYAKWIVQNNEQKEKNPGTGLLWQYGEAYDVPTSHVIKGIAIQNFSWTDQGCLHGRWIFELPKAFAVLELPVLCGHGGVLTTPDIEDYQSLNDQFVKSINIDGLAH